MDTPPLIRAAEGLEPSGSKRCPAHITGLSATPPGPACPSRASGRRSRASAWGASRVACVSLVSTCRCHYPGGIVGSNRSWDGLFHPFPCSPTTTAFPTPLAGRLPHRCLSRLAQHSLTLRPADSLHRRAAHLSRRLRRLRYLRRRSDSFRPERPSWPGGTCTHWETPPFHGAQRGTL